MTNIYNECWTTKQIKKEIDELLEQNNLTPYENLKMLYVMRGIVREYLSAHEKPKQKTYIPRGY